MITAEQQRELDKYPTVYAKNDRYFMRSVRIKNFGEILATFKEKGSILDVGCGRGEFLAHARKLGFGRCVGTEIVPAFIRKNIHYALAWDLPFADNEFNAVTLLDVIEHVLPGDDEKTCRELLRVANYGIIITANNRPSIWNGEELHVNKRPYEEWHELFCKWFDGCRVTWLHDKAASYTQVWRIDLK